MCPVRVHWHVKLNYKDYWRVKVAITNFNYRMNYTQWSLVAQHPNLNNVTQVFSFDYKPLVPYESISGCRHIIKLLNKHNACLVLEKCYTNSLFYTLLKCLFLNVAVRENDKADKIKKTL